MNNRTSITSSQEKQYRRFVEDATKHGADLALNKVSLDKDSLQKLLGRGGEFQSAIAEIIVAKTHELSISNQFADEEVSSNYTYPKGYKGPKPISEQVDALAKIFGLSLNHTSEFVEKILPTLILPDGTEGWFAIPRWEKLGSTLSAASQEVLAKIGESRKFYNHRRGELTPNRFCLNARTAHALELLTEQQKGDILIVGAQFGKRHAGRSVRRAREVFVHPEFGAHTIAAGSMLLTHPERLVSYNYLWMDIPGDEFGLDGGDSFDRAPSFKFIDGEVRFDTIWTSFARDGCGSVSLFLPQ